MRRRRSRVAAGDDRIAGSWLTDAVRRLERSPAFRAGVWRKGMGETRVRRSRVASLVLTASVLLVPATVVAQAPEWPTPTELRDTFTAVRGWQWGATLGAWHGGTDLLSAEGDSMAIMGVDPDGGVRVFVEFRSGEALWPWPRSVESGWTTFMEIASRLPVDQATLEVVRDAVLEPEPGCVDHPIPGGNLRLAVRDPGGPEGALVMVLIAQGGGPECPDPDATPSLLQP
jgi:hypothetical protein